MDLIHQSRGYLPNFLRGASHGALKSLNLSLCIPHLPIRDLCQVNLRIEHNGCTEAIPGAPPVPRKRLEPRRTLGPVILPIASA